MADQQPTLQQSGSRNGDSQEFDIKRSKSRNINIFNKQRQAEHAHRTSWLRASFEAHVVINVLLFASSSLTCIRSFFYWFVRSFVRSLIELADLIGVSEQTDAHTESQKDEQTDGHMSLHRGDAIAS